MANALYYGDNLAVLRESIASESVDLVYLDPPFNSQATYNLLFRSPTGAGSQAQIEAFEDTWHWNAAAESAFDAVITSGNTSAADFLRAIRSSLGENDMMAYLAMMAVRLIELHRVLKDRGSLYLHCDPTASHYLKVLLDSIFEPANYRSELSWKRSSAHNDAKQGRKPPQRASMSLASGGIRDCRSSLLNRLLLERSLRYRSLIRARPLRRLPPSSRRRSACFNAARLFLWCFLVLWRRV